MTFEIKSYSKIYNEKYILFYLNLNIHYYSYNEIKNIMKAITASNGFRHRRMTESVAGGLHDDVFP